MNRSTVPGLAGQLLLAVSTVLMIVAIALFALFNPWWVGAAQERAGVAGITGWSELEVERITNSIIADVILGPPTFQVTSVNGPVLDDAERGHMVDVYGVLRGFILLVLLAGGIGGLFLWRDRSEPSAWRAVSRGAGGLAVAGTALALLVVFVFDALFLAFHLVFFPGGNFSFDPATERLTQLFPGQFWTESAIAIVLLGTGLAGVVWGLTHWRSRRLTSKVPSASKRAGAS